MRKTALLWLVLAALCGGILFQTSQRVNDGRARLAEITAKTKKEEESLRVLQAEWSYLNQPERLEKLAERYLGLVPLKGKQFAKTEELQDRPATPPPGVAETPAAPAPEKIAEAPKPAAPKAAPPVKMQPITAMTPSPVLKPQPPLTQNQNSAAQKPQPPSTAWREPPRTAPTRDFKDVIKSLGVQ